MNHPDFTLIREQYLSEVGGAVRLWRHNATGAEVVSIINDDENKCFGVSFRTPPADSTGVPHILEHSVLCGSKKYRAKEPFVTLLKNSLNTFLNAMTYPDKTCYPVASANLQDFKNLADVYLDAVFFPLITENTFRQEGWHLEPDEHDPDSGSFSFKGVVYNEMKGVYSSPESILSEQSQQALFPNHVYGLNSGGDPKVIPSLTYEQFKAFHTRYYHPSNARFFFWGDAPEEDRLNMIAPYLVRFDKGSPAPEIPLMPCPEKPRLTEIPYAASGADGGSGDKAHITMNWILPESADIPSMLMLDALSHILTGLPGSPLRKALIESGLGEDLAGDGLVTDLRQAYYSVGLFSIDPENAPKVETLIMDTLAETAEEGIPADAAAAAMNSLEFSLRENNTGSMPRGLDAMQTCLESWLHGGDPIAALTWEEALADLKMRLARGEKIFEEAIRTYFLNAAPVTVLLLPDTALEIRRTAEEKAVLDRIRAEMSPDKRRETIRIADILHEEQERPDTPENIAAIPALTTADLPRTNKTIPSELYVIHTGADTDNAAQSEGTRALIHELPTNGIVYSSLVMPLDAVPARLIHLLPLYARSLTELGTKRRSFVEFGARIAAKTGGLGAGSIFTTNRVTKKTVARFSVGGKATVERLGDLYDLTREMLFEANFDNRERFALMAAEECARLEQGLIPAGHRAVACRLASQRSAADWLAENTGGITYLESVRALNDRIQKDWDGVKCDLEQLHTLIVNKNGALFNLTSDKSGIAAATALAERLTADLPDAYHTSAADRWMPQNTSADTPHTKNEAFIAPAQVNFVGASANLYAAGYTWHGSAAVAARHIRMDWLWNKVRVKGGAYGAFCAFDRVSGGISQISFRDPNVGGTLDVYRGTGEFLKNITLTQTELDQAVVGTVGDMDAYLLPDAKGRMALHRYLNGDTDEARQLLREEVFSTTAADIRRFGEAIDAASADARVCVLGGAAAESYAQEHGFAVKRIL